MDCYSFDRIISDYIDANLSGKQRQEANEHLSVCPRCCAKLADLKSILSGLKTLPQKQTSSDFESRLMDRIAQSKEQKESRFVQVFQDYSRPISVVAAVMLLVATSIFVYTSVVIPNASGSIPSAEIRSIEPAKAIPVSSVATTSARSALAGVNNEVVLPDSNKIEAPNFNNQIMMVNENK
jgi:putative zinc finger protein